MSIKTSVSISGLSDIKKALAKVTSEVAQKANRQALAKAATVIRDEAKSRAVVDTGSMQAAVIVKHVREESGGGRQAYIVTVRQGKRYREVSQDASGRSYSRSKVDKKGRKRDAYYWTFVEFGTRHTAARPFMSPAFEAKKSQAVDQYKVHIWRRIEAASRGQ